MRSPVHVGSPETITKPMALDSTPRNGLHRCEASVGAAAGTQSDSRDSSQSGRTGYV